MYCFSHWACHSPGESLIVCFFLREVTNLLRPTRLAANAKFANSRLASPAHPSFSPPRSFFTTRLSLSPPLQQNLLTMEQIVTVDETQIKDKKCILLRIKGGKQFVLQCEVGGGVGGGGGGG